jgi:hypothetical protein
VKNSSNSVALCVAALATSVQAHGGGAPTGWQVLAIVLPFVTCVGMILTVVLWLMGYKGRANLLLGTKLIGGLCAVFAPFFFGNAPDFLTAVQAPIGIFIFLELVYVSCWGVFALLGIVVAGLDRGIRGEPPGKD